MMFENFWDYVLSPTFVITFALVLAPFGALGYSILVTWLENRHLVEKDKKRKK